MEIAQIKSTLSMAQVLSYYGLKTDKYNKLCCPFHSDKSPSLQVYYSTKSWYCYGCNKGRDGIDFIQFQEKCSAHEAIVKAKEIITGLGNLTMKRLNNGGKDTEVITEQGVEKMHPLGLGLTEAERIALLTGAFSYFVGSVKGRDVLPKAYIKKRNLDINRLHIGYDGHLFHRQVDEGVKKQYVAVGLLYPDKLGRANNFHSFFDGCMVFPIQNKEGAIINLYGRSIDDSKVNKHRYLPGKHQGIYPHYPTANTQQLILTESIIDAASLVQVNAIQKKYSIMALYGTNGFTTEHTEAVSQLKNLTEVILFYDGDKAGREAVLKHSSVIKELCPKVTVSYVLTPDGEDINSLVQGHDETILLELLSERKKVSGNNSNFSFTAEPQASTMEENKIVIPVEAKPLTAMNQGVETSIEKNNISHQHTQEKLVATTSKGGAVFSSTHPDRLQLTTDYLQITVWGGIDIYGLKKLRVTLYIQSKSNAYISYRDSVDLYSHTQTQKLLRDGSEQLEISSSIMQQSISSLTHYLEQYRDMVRNKERARAEEERNKNKELFTSQEMQAGETFLKDKSLMQKTEAHLYNIGLVGEEEKGLLLFFILLTRMFKEPLHALVQGKSGSGKTYLLKKVASLVPKSQIRITTALTENTLYHSLQDFWKHMILLIEDLDGAFSALLPLREMMSNQSISKLSTEKDLKSGEFVQKMLYVEGPICVAGATTKDKIYEDNANRSFLIQVNESNEHQERVLAYQRKNIAGLLDKSQQKQTQTLLKTAQLHLQNIEVVIPFGNDLRLPDEVFKKLRTNAHYLTLIKSIAFWHQRQRKILTKEDGTPYIEASLEDVYWANKLSKEVLLRKSDELTGALRHFFESLKHWLTASEQTSFYAKPLREKLKINPMQMNRYLKELDQRGYVKQTGGNRKIGFEYSIVVWNDYEQLKIGINSLDTVLDKLKMEV